MNLSNNTVLITGGTSGIGLTLGRALLKHNNTVILLGSDSAKIEKVKKEGFATIACDLTKNEDIEKAVFQIQNNYPRLNILFNNAGVQFNYDFITNIIPVDKIEQEMMINVTSQILLTQQLIPVLNNAKQGFIINTTSGLGAFPKNDGIVYSASKAAMRNFTKGLGYRLKNTSIRVLEFIPPVTDTEMTKGRSESKMSAEMLVDQILPQLKKEKKILTIPKMRAFLWIAFLFPGIAHKIVSR